MLLMAINRSRPLGFLFLLTTSFSLVLAQESSVASPGGPLANLRVSTLTSSGLPNDPATILARFVEVETKGREALNQHTFKRDVVLQTIGRRGEVTGEYIRNSQFLFDDQGRRIERVLFHPPSQIHEMRITKEDIQDLAGGQLLGIDIVEATKYQLTYAGSEIVDSRQLFAIDVTPLTKPDPKRMRERFFVGRVWVEPINFQIVKIKGVVEPRGKQRFPVFETWREPINGAFAFPIRTEADDVLHFPEGDVHYRIKVNYYDYKLFGSKVTITDVDEAQSSSLTPTTSPKPKSNQEVCVTNRSAPPVSPYHWAVDAEVKVYLVRNMFTSEQRGAVLEALKTWTMAGNETDAGVKFTYAGETAGLVNCRSCLTVTRRDVYKNDGSHYSFFNPLSSEEGRVLLSAWIDLDFATTDPRALQGFVAHELGHGMGLWDCETCKKKRTLMNGFPGINKDNGLIAPSRCDLETLKTVYVRERQVAAAKSYGVKNSEQVQTARPLALAPLSLASAPSTPVLDLQRPSDGASLLWWDLFFKF
jgi:hypothetical protein